MSAPATFQYLMDKVLHWLTRRTLLLYLDDIMGIGPDLEVHLAHLEEVPQQLQVAGLKLKPSNRVLLRQKVKFLCHGVSEEGMPTDHDKAYTVAMWPVPKNLKEPKAFQDTVSCYHQYIADFAKITRSLTQLTCKNTPWEWSDSSAHAFQIL